AGPAPARLQARRRQPRRGYRRAAPQPRHRRRVRTHGPLRALRHPPAALGSAAQGRPNLVRPSARTTGGPPIMLLDRHGWLAPGPGIRRAPSPNCDTRPAGTQVSLLVLHNISLPPGRFGGPYVEALFTNTLDCAADPWFARLRGLRVSAHFFIRRDGEIVQFVSTEA